jgi:hypothetical protein
MLRRKRHSAAADEADDFRRKAEACRRLAAIEPSEDETSYWLRRADEWQKLAAEAERLSNRK